MTLKETFILGEGDAHASNFHLPFVVGLIYILPCQGEHCCCPHFSDKHTQIPGGCYRSDARFSIKGRSSLKAGKQMYISSNRPDGNLAHTMRDHKKQMSPPWLQEGSKNTVGATRHAGVN